MPLTVGGGVRSLDDLLHVRELGVTRIGATATAPMLEEAKSRFEAAKAVKASVEARVRSEKANQDKADADLQNAEARRTVTERTRDRLQKMDDYRFIRAPFSGIVTQRGVDHGEFVRPATSNSGAM